MIGSGFVAGSAGVTPHVFEGGYSFVSRRVTETPGCTHRSGAGVLRLPLFPVVRTVLETVRGVEVCSCDLQAVTGAARSLDCVAFTKFAGDNHLLDLAGALTDDHQRRVPEVALHVVFLGVSVAAVDT